MGGLDLGLRRGRALLLLGGDLGPVACASPLFLGSLLMEAVARGGKRGKGRVLWAKFFHRKKRSRGKGDPCTERPI